MRALWSQPTGSSLRGLSLARERGWVLAWDLADGLHLFNRAGERQGKVKAAAPISTAAAADDGLRFAAGGSNGQVWLFTPDLMPRWEEKVPGRCVAVALDPFGQYLAAADSQGGLHVWDRAGRRVSRSSHPRPLTHLCFVPEKPILLGAADFGLVCCLDLSGRVLWRDGLVAHIGALSARGDGSLIVAACFSAGLYAYGLDGPPTRRLLRSVPCRSVSLSYAGSQWLVGGLDQQLYLMDQERPQKDLGGFDGDVLGLALAPLADLAWVGLTPGRVLCLDLDAPGP